MTDFRVRSYEAFEAKPMPNWGSEVLGQIDFNDIFYYIKPTDGQSKTWEDLPAEIKNTYDRLGIPEAEKKYLAGVGAQYESEVIYHSLAKDLESKGVIFMDTDSALREHPEMFREYFGTIIPLQRQQVCCAEQRGVVGRLVYLCAEGCEDRYAVAGVFPHQCQERRPV